MIKKIIAIGFFSISLFVLNINFLFAQIDSTTLAVFADFQDGVPGQLICTSPEGFILCDKENDPAIYGVVVENPTIAINDSPPSEADLIAQSGSSILQVSNDNGEIKVGDLLTSSTTPGVAVKATRNGQVIGNALEPYNFEVPGTIIANIHIHNAATFTDQGSNLYELLRQGLASPVLTPLAALRYLIAAFIVIFTFLLSFIYFGRVIKNMMQNIGRNPQASTKIYFAFFVSLTFIIGALGFGLFLAYLILSL